MLLLHMQIRCYFNKICDKASLLTASGMLLHAFPSMSVSSLREFPENCVYRHDGFNCFIKYFHVILLTTNFSFMILKVLKNVHLLDLYIKTIIFLFYNYIHVFNSNLND
jgi:hypothetical protein